jgi:hypothetical protein
MQNYFEMIKLAGVRAGIFDLGRSCTRLSQRTLEDCLARRKAYPMPFMGKALLLVTKAPPGREESREMYDFDAINLPLDEDGMIVKGALEAYTISMVSERMAMASNWAGGRGVQSRSLPGSKFSWMPTWGEAFMAQGHFARSEGGASVPERVAVAAERLRSRAMKSKVSAEFSWSDDLGVPELGLAELIVRAKESSVLGEALAEAVEESSLSVLTSLCEFMTHAELPRPVIEAVSRRTKDVMKSVAAGDAIYGQLVQCLGGSKDFDAMTPVLNAILDHRIGGNAEILTRVVRYHRQLMGENRSFEIDKVLEPATRKPSGMDVFLAYVTDMIEVESLGQRILVTDFGVLSPGVKARLRQAMGRMER